MANLKKDNVIIHNQLVRIARLYYLCKMTHQEIAEREGLSRISVTRLIKKAVDNRIVEFNIKDPIIKALDLEDQIQKTFNLEKVIITPTPPDDDIFDILGRFAADFLIRNCRNNIVIGVGWGRTLNGMLPYLRKTHCKNIRIVTLTGGLAANSRQPNPYDVVSAMAAKLQVNPEYPLVPAIVENEKAKGILLKDKKFQEVTVVWDKIDIALMSIGVVSYQTGFYYSFANPKKEAEKARKLGAVGDLLANPFDQDGNFIKTSFANRIIEISFDQLKKINLVVGIAGGEKKSRAILGSLRSGYLNVLITDEQTAKKVLYLNSMSQKA